VQGFDDGTQQPGSGSNRVESVYRTTVVVRRFGEAIFPVKVVTRFADGHQTTESWDGVDRWRLYSYDRPAEAVSVVVDPDRILLLDVNYTNNSASIAPASAGAATKWSMKWMVWLQDLMLTWSFFV
jgi:hypothetical protein